MKALLLSSPGALAVADVDTPTAAAGEVLVRIAACGICGSDVHGYTGGSGRRIPPLVMGHEASGTIEAVGAGVWSGCVYDEKKIATRLPMVAATTSG
jgi:L-iditol 2-dehydrogenase